MINHQIDQIGKHFMDLSVMVDTLHVVWNLMSYSFSGLKYEKGKHIVFGLKYKKILSNFF